MKKLNLITLVLKCILMCSILASCSSNKKKNEADKKADLYYGQGTNLLVSKDYTKALRSLLEANKYRPNDTKILNNLGMVYYFKKSPSNAKRFLTRAIEVDAKNSDARMNLATIYMSENKLDEANKQYQMILKDLVYEHQYKTYYNLAVLELKRNNKNQAKKYLKESVAVNENYCPGYFKLGKLSFDEGNFKHAKKMFKEASMGLCYKLPEPQYYKALSLIKLKEYFEAEQVLESMTENFAMTKWEATAQNEILRLKKINSLENSDALQAKKSKRNFLTPDF